MSSRGALGGAEIMKSLLKFHCVKTHPAEALDIYDELSPPRFAFLARSLDLF